MTTCEAESALRFHATLGIHAVAILVFIMWLVDRRAAKKP
jgi:hypothetical protein